MKTIRQKVFETNSSSTHCVTIMGEDEFDAIKNGTVWCSEWYDNPTKLSELIDTAHEKFCNEIDVNVIDDVINRIFPILVDDCDEYVPVGDELDCYCDSWKTYTKDQQKVLKWLFDTHVFPADKLHIADIETDKMTTKHGDKVVAVSCYQPG